jgi:hypothetical protein
MSSTHPAYLRRTAARGTADAAHRRRDLHRLITHYWALSGRLITAQAHGGCDDQLVLIDTVAAIEDALDSRHPRMWQAVQGDLHLALLEAEHTGDRSTPAADCLVCRRLGEGLPGSIRQLIGLGQVR